MLNWLPLTLLTLIPLSPMAAAPAPISPRVALAENQGFCPGPDSFNWEVPKPSGIQVWTSLCGSGAADQAIAVTQSFRAPAHLSLYLLGWMKPGQQGMSLENPASGAVLAIRPDEAPGGGWQLISFAVPGTWQGSAVRLKVWTARSGDLTWVGFSEPFEAGDLSDYRGAGGLLLRLFEYYLLLSFVFFATVVAALRSDFRDPCLLLFFGLAGTGTAGYAAFWLWFLLPEFRHPFSVLVPLLSAVYLGWTWRRMQPAARQSLIQTAKPWLLAFSVALFVLAAGFLYGGLENPIGTAQSRFSHQLPMDNFLQYVFSQQIISRTILHPMISDWLSSDRPPLETGFTLLQLPYVLPPRALAYTVLGVLLQSFWAPALWAFLKSLGVDRRITVWVLTTAIFSGFVLVNSFFVWPKLLAAAYMLGFSMLLLAPRFANELRTRTSVALLAGALLALSVLSHGGSAFALLGLIPTLLILRKAVPLRSAVLIAAALLAFYLPWTAYQKFSDPPGDRLLKMHLAGVDRPTAESFLRVLGRSYATTPWSQIVEARKANAATIIGPLGKYWNTYWSFVRELPRDLVRGEKSAGAPGSSLRSIQFFHFFPALGFFMTGPILLLAGIWPRFRNEIWRAALLCWVYVICTIVIWWMIMFVPQGAIIVSGSYAANVLAFAGGVLALAAISRRFAIAIVSFHIAISFILYVMYAKVAPSPGTLPEGVVHTGELLLLIASLLLLFVMLRVLSRGELRSLEQESKRVSMDDPALRTG